MKDILRVMKFDFVTANLNIIALLIAAVVFCAVGMFFTPSAMAFLYSIPFMYIFPLSMADDKYKLSRLYAILPVKRKNVTRARFMYIFAMFFFAEIIILPLSRLSCCMKLYRYIPIGDAGLRIAIEKSFANYELVLKVIAGAMIGLCLFFSYLETINRIFGKDKIMFTLTITLVALISVFIAYTILSGKGIIPKISIPDVPVTLAGKIGAGILINSAMLLICMIFGEITAKKVSAREV